MSFGHLPEGLDLAVDEVARAFGWKNFRTLWLETRKFKTNLALALKDYTNSGLVKPEKLAVYMKQLIEFPDPDNDVLVVIDGAIEDLANGSFGRSVDDLLDTCEAGDLEDYLRGQRDEQAWEDYETASECERYETD